MSTSYQIHEAARRSGFTPATLRYYEEIGLLPEAVRTSSGYRMYDDRTLERLAFIARAKRLGCSLDETAELVTAWDGGECAPVQARLRDVVEAKIFAAKERIAELEILVGELEDVAGSLQDRTAGPCDDECGCAGVSLGPTRRLVTTPWMTDQSAAGVRRGTDLATGERP